MVLTFRSLLLGRSSRPLLKEGQALDGLNI